MVQIVRYILCPGIYNEWEMCFVDLVLFMRQVLPFVVEDSFNLEKQHKWRVDIERDEGVRRRKWSF